MSFISYATEATGAATRDWAGFFKTINNNLANMLEFSARGFGTPVEGDPGVVKGEGFTSVFRTISTLSSDMFSKSA